MASFNKKRLCNHRKKCGVKKKNKYAIVFASTHLRIIRLCKYPFDPKAYLGHCTCIKVLGFALLILSRFS